MKKQALKVFSMLSLSVILGVVSAHANPAGPVKANIPFDFTVANKTLPAGAYTVVPMTTPNVLLIRHEDGRAAAIVITNPMPARQEQGQTKLVFRRYGDQYFLAQVWTEGDS